MSVIVPCFLQEETIEADIGRLDRALSEVGAPYEVIVVVDGESDSTFERARETESKQIHVLSYLHNHGKGYAVRFGMARARGDVIAFIDAGGDIDAQSISMAFEHFRWYNADIIVGSKRHPVSKVNYPISRKILSWGYQLLVRLLFDLRIRDTQVGLKLFRRQVLEDVLPRLLVKRFAFDIEMLAVAHRLGYTRIFESPIELDFTGVSSITTTTFWRIIFRMLWDTLAVFYRLKILRYYDNANKRKWRFDPELNFRVNVG